MDAPPGVERGTPEPPPAVRPRILPRTVLVNAVCFILGFVLVQWAFDRLDSPFQAAEQKVGSKFAYFAAHKDSYDVVFVGSSRVLNQISPRVFDTRMAAAGHPCHSFNLGYVGMYLPECSFLVDRILTLHPAKLRLLVMELSNPTPRAGEIGSLTDRQVYWHRPGPTLLACSAILTNPPVPGESVGRGPQILWQVQLLARCLCHVGDGPGFVLERFNRRRHSKTEAAQATVGRDQQGFVPLSTQLGGGIGAVTGGGGKEELDAFIAATETMQRGDRLEPAPTTKKENRADVFGHWLLRRCLARRVRTLDRAKITSVFFIGPSLTREETFVDWHADGTLPRLAAFNDPVTNPELYDPKVRADRYHLNAEGADLLTRQLAARVLLQGWADKN